MPTWESNFRAAASAVGKRVHILKVVEYSALAPNVDGILIRINLDLLRNSIAIWLLTLNFNYSRIRENFFDWNKD